LFLRTLAALAHVVPPVAVKVNDAVVAVEVNPSKKFSELLNVPKPSIDVLPPSETGPGVNPANELDAVNPELVAVPLTFTANP